jgi:hypothetical protein
MCHIVNKNHHVAYWPDGLYKSVAKGEGHRFESGRQHKILIIKTLNQYRGATWQPVIGPRGIQSLSK